MDKGSSRLAIVDVPCWEIELEYTKDTVIIHLPRAELTVTSYRYISKKFRELCKFLRLHYAEVYTAIPDGRDDLVRLSRLFEFEYQGSADGFDVYIYLPKGE